MRFVCSDGPANQFGELSQKIVRKLEQVSSGVVASEKGEVEHAMFGSRRFVPGKPPQSGFLIRNSSSASSMVRRTAVRDANRCELRIEHGCTHRNGVLMYSSLVQGP